MMPVSRAEFFFSGGIIFFNHPGHHPADHPGIILHSGLLAAFQFRFKRDLHETVINYLLSAPMMHHPGVILLTETSACIILPSACIILPSSCHHPSPPAFPVLIHRLLSNCHRLASSCHHPVVILLSPCNFIDCNRVSSIRNDLHWFYMLLIDSHTLLLHFMFLNTVIYFHCVFINLIRCWSVFISFHSFCCYKTFIESLVCA